MHYSDRIAELQAICLSSLPDTWRAQVAEYVKDVPPEQVPVLIECLRRQVKRETRLLAAKKAVLTILTKPSSKIS